MSVIRALDADIGRDGEGAIGHGVMPRESGLGHVLVHDERREEKRHRWREPVMYERMRVGERTVFRWRVRIVTASQRLMVGSSGVGRSQE